MNEPSWVLPDVPGFHCGLTRWPSKEWGSRGRGGGDEVETNETEKMPKKIEERYTQTNTPTHTHTHTHTHSREHSEEDRWPVKADCLGVCVHCQCRCPVDKTYRTCVACSTAGTPYPISFVGVNEVGRFTPRPLLVAIEAVEPSHSLDQITKSRHVLRCPPATATTALPTHVDSSCGRSKKSIHPSYRYLISPRLFFPASVHHYYMGLVSGVFFLGFSRFKFLKCIKFNRFAVT